MRTGSLLLALLALLAAAMLITAGCTSTPPTNQTTAATTAPAGNATPVATGNVTPANTSVTNATPVNITAPFVNATWRWIARAGSQAISVPSPDHYTVKFNTNGTYALRADCNNGTGNYTVNATKVKIGAANMTTKTYCGDASLDKTYAASLAAVTAYEMDASGRLILIMVNPIERLTFEKVK